MIRFASGNISFLQYSQEDGGEDEPERQKDPDGVGELVGVTGVGNGNTEDGMNNGSVEQPEIPVTGEN
jgi:hypothetical protein